MLNPNLAFEEDSKARFGSFGYTKFVASNKVNIDQSGLFMRIYFDYRNSTTKKLVLVPHISTSKLQLGNTHVCRMVHRG